MLKEDVYCRRSRTFRDKVQSRTDSLVQKAERKMIEERGRDAPSPTPFPLGHFTFNQLLLGPSSPSVLKRPPSEIYWGVKDDERLHYSPSADVLIPTQYKFSLQWRSSVGRNKSNCSQYHGTNYSGPKPSKTLFNKKNKKSVTDLEIENCSSNS